MKKLGILFLSVIISTAALAAEYKGKIVNLVSDEEGIKIILSSDESKKSVTSAYLTNHSKNFLQNSEILKLAQSNLKTIKIQTKDNAIAEVLTLEILN